jgi:hypothetical protein
MPSWMVTVLIAMAIEYALAAVWFAVQALECSHGATGFKADRRIVLEAVGWPLVHVPWRQWYSMKEPSNRHELGWMRVAA